MYFWLVLSTFMAFLAGYALPLRSDTGNQLDVSIAKAHVMKMVINHKIVLKDLRFKKAPYACKIDPVPEGGCPKEASITFTAGPVDYDGISANAKTEEFNIDKDNYESFVFCFNDGGTEILDDGADCNDSAIVSRKRYLVTYGDLDEKWLALRKEAVAGAGGDDEISAEYVPKDDVMKALGEHFKDDSLIGYIFVDDDGIHLINSMGLKIFTFGENMYAKMTGVGCNENYNGSCIAYVSAL